MFHRLSHIKGVPATPELWEARFKRFLRELKTYEQRLSFERTMDAFLDLYSSWKRSHSYPVKLRLVMLAFELRRLNQDFRCDLTFRDEPACEKSPSGT